MVAKAVNQSALGRNKLHGAGARDRQQDHRYRLSNQIIAMDRRSFLATISAAAAESVFGQSASVADLKGDIAILRSALQLHPGLYRYSARDEVEERALALESAFTSAKDQATRYLALSSFLASIRCGHTYANFFNQSTAVSADLFDRPTRLPFRFRWLERRMVVTEDPNQLGLVPGTEVSKINGLPAAKLLDTLLPYARADGHNDAKRRALLEVQGFERIEYFDVFHGLIFDQPHAGVHRIEVKSPDGRNSIVEVPALDVKQRRAQMRSQPAKDAALWDWRMESNGVAVLTMPTWAVYDSKWDWRGWLEQRLDSLRDARSLVLDLRGNEGGNDCGDSILARLAERPIQMHGVERRVRFRSTPPALDPYLDTWDNSFRSLGEGAEAVGDGFYRLSAQGKASVIAPEGPRFTGRVAVLIGPACSSATFQFATLAHDNGLARLFGEPTGGNRRGINGAAFFFVRLPASGLEFDLPLVGYFPTGNPPDAGLDPDVRMMPTARDVAAGRDRVFEAAASWVRST